MAESMKDAPGRAVQLTLFDLAEMIHTEHAACLAAATDMIRHAIEVGRLLAAAKEQIEHGEWIPWVNNNCPFDRTQASRYLKAFNNKHLVEDQMMRGSHHLGLESALRAIKPPKPLDADEPSTDGEPVKTVPAAKPSKPPDTAGPRTKSVAVIGPVFGHCDETPEQIWADLQGSALRISMHKDKYPLVSCHVTYSDWSDVEAQQETMDEADANGETLSDNAIYKDGRIIGLVLFTDGKVEIVHRKDIKGRWK